MNDIEVGWSSNIVVGDHLIISGSDVVEVLFIHGNTLLIDQPHPWWWRVIEAILLWLD